VTDAAIHGPVHRRWIAPLVGLFFALIVPAILTTGTPDAAPTSISTIGILLNEGVMWTLTAIVVAVILFWEKRPLQSIGLSRPTYVSLRAGVGIALLLIVLALVGATIIDKAGVSTADKGQGEMVIGMSGALQALVALTAGFTEEILFRGYAVTRFTELTGSRWWGAIIPVVFFGGIHAPFWGVGHALVAGLSGLWLTLVFLWRRNLWTNITAHALLDALVFVSVDILAALGATTA
jgi:uncharacterized protein